MLMVSLLLQFGLCGGWLMALGVLSLCATRIHL